MTSYIHQELNSRKEILYYIIYPKNDVRRNPDGKAPGGEEK